MSENRRIRRLLKRQSNVNFILLSDAYKYTHKPQYPPNTAYINSYIEARGSALTDSTVFFGLQAFIIEYLEGVRITLDDVDEAELVINGMGLPFEREAWEYIVTAYDGRLPISIQAVPEGMVVGLSNVLVQLINTDPKCYWLTSFVETPLLRAVWYTTTVASQSKLIKEVIKGYLEKTGDVTGLPFKLHDFGCRGVSSMESAELGGMAHLINFQGTDTVSAVAAASRYYDCDAAGFSIPAGEHSTYTSWGRDGEIEAYRNMLNVYGGEGKIFAAVSDSYDIDNAVQNIWGGVLRQEVVDSGAVVVIRPDSGDPIETPVRCVEMLADKFGTVTNEKGYKVLNNVRVIQGDGVCYEGIKSILAKLVEKGFSADNIAFGMGGALLQGIDRDTFQFAMKASLIIFNDGTQRDVYKDPKGSKSKRSKMGRLALIDSGFGLKTIREDDLLPTEKNLLVEVFRDGKRLVNMTFDEVRELSNQ